MSSKPKKVIEEDKSDPIKSDPYKNDPFKAETKKTRCDNRFRDKFFGVRAS